MDLAAIVAAGEALAREISKAVDAASPELAGKDTTWIARRNTAVLMASDAVNLAVGIMELEAER